MLDWKKEVGCDASVSCDAWKRAMQGRQTGFVRDREFSEVVSNHLALNFNGVECFAVVNLVMIRSMDGSMESFFGS